MATIKVNGNDRSTGYTQSELEAISLRFTAQDGEVGQGNAPIPDPAGSLFNYAGQSFQVIDPDTTLVIDGFVGPLVRERGETAADPRLLDTYTIGDENAVLHGFRAYRWVRPAETTRARFLAFLAAYVPWVTDTTWVTTDVVASMAAHTYTTETLFDELMTEIKDLTGNTAFVENHRGHLHPPTVGILGGLAFSDTTYDWVTSFPPLAGSPRRSKDPIDLRDDVMVTTPGGKATATDGPAIAIYDAGGLKHQALVQLGTGSAADAAAKAAAILSDSKRERIMYEFDAGPMTSAQLASIPVGCLVNVTSSVLGLTSSTQRIGGLTAKYVHPNRWIAHLELGFPVRRRVAAPRTTPPVDSLTAQAKLEPCGAPMSWTGYHRNDIESVPGTWLAGISSDGVACGLSVNQGWPGTACGIGLGAFHTHGDTIAAIAFTAPADSHQIGALVSLGLSAWGNAVACPGLGHIGGLLCGTVPILTDVLVYAIAGATPGANDLAAPATRAAGDGNNMVFPRSAFTFGGGNRIVIGPAEHVNTDYACVGDILITGIHDTGVYITPVVQFMCLVDGAYGWIDAAPVESFNGTRTLFTLIGGYKIVDSVSLNGVVIPSDAWTATDGSTLTTLGWAPIAGDVMLAHYYIPQ